MNQAQTYLNTYQLRDLTGLTTSNIKYHRRKGNIKSYQLAGQKQHLYKLTDVNQLVTEHTDLFIGQETPKLAIIKSNSTLQEGNS